MCVCDLDHLISLGLRVTSSHGQDPDFLSFGATVSQRQSHFSMGGTVCGVGPRKRDTQIKLSLDIKKKVYLKNIEHETDNRPSSKTDKSTQPDNQVAFRVSGRYFRYISDCTGMCYCNFLVMASVFVQVLQIGRAHV